VLFRSNDSDNMSESSKSKSSGINYCQRIQPQLASLTISTNSSNCLNSEAQKKLKNTSVNMCQSQKRIESKKNVLREKHIHDIKAKQQELMNELSATKNYLMAEDSFWSYDLHVDECMSSEDEGYLEALQKETEVLEKRVIAAKQHIMMITSFDASAV